MKNQSKTLIVILLVLTGVAFLPGAQAVCNEGCGSNFNTFEGEDALINDTAGAGNTAFGWRTLFADTDGSFNTAVGVGALVLNDGSSNTAVGAAALLLNTTGSDNTAVGTDALANNTADGNTATGAFALSANTTGGSVGGLPPPSDILMWGPNVAIGHHVLESNTLSGANVAVGYQALASFVEGSIIPDPPNPDIDLRPLGGSTAVGFQALANATGFLNTAVGYRALFNTTGGFNGTEFEGTQNVALGPLALFSNITGSFNTAIGIQPLFNNQTGDNNIAIGVSAGFNTDGDNNILIGHQGVAGESNTIRIGNGFSLYNVYITGVATVGLGNGTPVLIDPATNQLGITPSSRRFKKEIESMDKVSEGILALKPVTFHYKNDKTDTPQFGLIAEEVAEVNSDLVVRDKNGDVFTVRYEAINAMLLNEFLKEHKKVEAQQATIAELKSMVAQQQKGMEVLTAQLKEQAAQIQKVSAQLEMSKPAPQVVANKP